MLPDVTSVEAEVLGACLLAPGVYVDRLAIDCGLTPDDFSHPPYARAWQAILDLHAADGTVTLATLAAAINDERAAGPGMVDDLLAAAGAVSSVIPNGRLLKHTALRRTRQQAGWKLVEAAEQDDESLVTQAELMLASPTVSDDTHNPTSIGEAATEFLEATGAVGMPSGFLELDNTLGGGLRPGDSTALGAWTSMGKSALVDQILTHAVLATGARCHAYINEMSVVDRALRMIARQSSIPYGQLVVRNLTAEQKATATRVAQKLPFGLTDCAQWSAAQISRHIRANKWDLCTVDLLHNMSYRDVAELDQIVATLAAAARTANSHLIIVCQFNEERAKSDYPPQPVSRDLRGSGMIKNACANVLLLHRLPHRDGDVVFQSADSLLIVDKARHGQRKHINLEFDPESMNFETTGLRAVAA